MNTNSMKKIYFMCGIIVSSTMTFAQNMGKQGAELDNFIATTTKEKELVKESSNQMMNGFFANADKIADKLLSIDNGSANYNYRKGYTQFMLGKNPKQVIPYLSKASSKKVKKTVDVYSTKDVAPVDVYYYLGVSYHRLEKLDSAKYFYQLYTEKAAKKNVLHRYAKARITQCENAKKQIENKNKDIVVTNLGPVVNTEFPEYSSVLSRDGKTIFYTSRRPWGGDTSKTFMSAEEGWYPEDIYSSKKTGGTWANSKRIVGSSPMYNEAVITLHAGQNQIYTYTDSTGRGDIYYSDANKADLFADETLLNISGINEKKSWETSIFFTKDGRRLYFSSDRKGGYGGRDLYYCEKDNNGNWSEPKNMGPAINSAFDEESPFVSNDGKYFLYSSNSEQSMGGFDVFYAPASGNGFGTGKPLDYPLNSTEDDVFYTSSSNNYKGYLTSSRVGSFGDKDIYEIDLNYIGLDKSYFAVIDFKMPTENTPIPENTRVRFVCNDCAVKSIENIADKDDNQVIQALEPCKDYYFEYISTIDGEESVFKTDTVKTDCNLVKQEIKKTVVIEKEKQPEVAKPLPVTDYRKDFAYNKNTIVTTEKTYKEMVTKVKETLKNDKDAVIVFEIYSSASSVPTQKYGTNEKLAQLRANNAMAELIKEFSKDMDMFSRIKIEIKDVKVDGPAYANDAQDMGKYAPFQFVEVKAFKK